MPVKKNSVVHRGCSPDDNLSSILTVDEVAELLRVNRNTVYDLFNKGELPGGRRVGRRIRFSRDVVVRWLSRANVCESHDEEYSK